MSLAVPLSLLLPWQFLDTNGDPLSGGKITTVLAGTVTPLPTYADCQAVSANANPVVCDASGYVTAFGLPVLYDCSVTDSNDVPIHALDKLGIGNPGQIFAASYGTVQATGTTAVSSGYSVLPTDNLVTYVTGSPGTVNLPAASVRSSTNTGNGLPILFCNFSASTLGLVPNGGDLVNTLNSTLTLAAGKTALAYSDGVSAWVVHVSG